MENFNLIAGNTKYWLGDKGSIKENDYIYTFRKHEDINCDYEVNITLQPNNPLNYKWRLEYKIPSEEFGDFYDFLYFSCIKDIIKFRTYDLNFSGFSERKWFINYRPVRFVLTLQHFIEIGYESMTYEEYLVDKFIFYKHGNKLSKRFQRWNNE
jgi:hypothetical protein